MVEAGIVVFLGLLFLFLKLPKWIVLIGLGYHLWVDVIAAVIAYALHWGTFTGTMAAAMAGLLTSVMTSLGRQWWGFTVYNKDLKKWIYYRGVRKLF